MKLRAIDFVIAGAPKGATTSICRHLSKHPDLCIGRRDPAFCTLRWHLGIDNLFDHIMTNGNCKRFDQLIGFKEPDILPHYLAQDRLKWLANNPKIIISLRNPVYRYYSHYAFISNFRERTKTPPHPPILEYIKQNRKGLRRFAKTTIDRAYERNYLQQGIYVEQLEYLYKLFDDSNILIIITERLKQEWHRI
jgi:hypothetical protein